MSVAYYGLWPKQDDRDSAEVAGRIAAGVNARLAGSPVAGGLFHAEGPTGDGGWWTFDLWESDDAYRAFVADVLAPAMAEVGVTAAAGDMRRLEVRQDTAQLGNAPPQG